MKNNKKTLLTLLVVLACVVIPTSFAWAINPPAAPITNPLGNNTTVPAILKLIINWLLSISALLALLALIWGGMKMILEFTSEDSAKEGKTIIKWAVIGLVVVAGAYTILSTVTGFLGINP